MEKRRKLNAAKMMPSCSEHHSDFYSPPNPKYYSRTINIRRTLIDVTVQWNLIGKAAVFKLAK